MTGCRPWQDDRVTTGSSAATDARGRHRTRRLAVWRSPDDQRGWARPSLLSVALVAGLLYGWRMGSSIEIFYAAGARSMSMSWHNFVYAAFDPAGTISVDKLPGAIWLQALSVRLFGVHTWALALPEVIEGVLTVLVLYRVVRRLAGPVAGLVAAGVLALSPAAVTLNRGNISDTLLILLLVLAADSAVTALTTERRTAFLVAGVWVGLAFQAKMIEAWLVLPVLALVILVAAPAALWRRLAGVAALVAVAIAVSVSWMTFVSLTPAAHRPFVDGSQHNSVFEQVFDYNGVGRVGKPSPNVELGRVLHIAVLESPPPATGWNRLLTGSYGRDAGWLLPASAVVVVAGLLACRRRPRTDVERAGIILWGGWLAVFGAFFSASPSINTYYLAALAPAVAGLVGIGVHMAWVRRRTVGAQVAVLVAVGVTTVYAYWLLPDSGTGLPAWLAPAVLVLGLVAVAVLVAAMVRPPGDTGSTVGLGLAAAALLVVPTVATVSVVADTLGAFDTPFQPAAVTAFSTAFFGAPLRSVSTLPKIEQARNGAPDLMATETSVLAAPFIYATGQEVLPIGGYTGTTPSPTVADIRRMVATGRFHLVLAAQGSADHRIVWIATHCLPAPPVTPPAGEVTGPLSIYFCVGPAGR